MDAEAATFKVLADPTRLRLAALLADHGETCVCELAAALDVPDFRVSRHLGIMKLHGLVGARRQGTWMHYRLAPPRGRLDECLQACFRDCLAAHPLVVADRQRLHAYQEQQRTCCAGRGTAPSEATVSTSRCPPSGSRRSFADPETKP